jgi:uncharacterized protein
MLLRIFWNAQEKRLRSLWRLLLQLVILGLGYCGAWFVQGRLLQALPDGQSGYYLELGLAVCIVLQLVPIELSVWLAARLLDRRKFSAFGFQLTRRWLADFLFGLVLGAVLMGGIFVTEWGAGWVHIQGLLQGSPPGVPFWISFGISLLLFLVVGFQEELLFRGYQLTNLAEGFACRRIGTGAALALATVISSASFGVLHLANNEASLVSTLNITVAGIMLACGYVMTRQLAIPIGLHISWNFCQGTVFGFPVSGNVIPPTLIATNHQGNPLITGGAFGPEAGLIGLVAMVLGAAATVAWVKFSRRAR